MGPPAPRDTVFANCPVSLQPTLVTGGSAESSGQPERFTRSQVVARQGDIVTHDRRTRSPQQAQVIHGRILGRDGYESGGPLNGQYVDGQNHDMSGSDDEMPPPIVSGSYLQVTHHVY
jgi:hypothetical protein